LIPNNCCSGQVKGKQLKKLLPLVLNDKAMLFLTQSRKVRQVFVICFAFSLALPARACVTALRDAVFYSMFMLSLTTSQFAKNLVDLVRILSCRQRF
jgi:hypothetical protein